MFSTNRPPSEAVGAGAFAKLTAGADFVRRTVARRSVRRWVALAIAAVVALYILWRIFLVAVQIATTDMWFDSVGHGAVYRTDLEAQILLFCVFAVIGGVIGGLTLVTLRRLHRPLRFSQDDDTFRWLFRRYERRLRIPLVALAVIVPGYLLGTRAAAGWQTYLLWRHATPWHQRDPQFHKDISFFVEVNPFHKMVVGLLVQAVVYGLWIAVIGGYWYGGWRLRRGSRKIVRGFTRLVSVLGAGYLLFAAAGYWVARYSIMTSAQGPVTGAGYTARTATLPSRTVLTVVALVLAVALLANVALKARVRVSVAVVAVMAVAAAVVGSAWPALLYHFREAPSAAKLDRSEIAHNLAATRRAFGLRGNVTTVGYTPSSTSDVSSLRKLANSTAQISLIDPNKLSPTFNVKQQLQAYYGFKSTLDTGQYEIDGADQDVALAVRELRSKGIPHPSWVNNHLVYTHGYGIVAAPTTEIDSKTESPVFLDGGIPPGKQIPVTQPDVYFGQAFSSSSYSIVGQPAGSKRHLEFDHPGVTGSSRSVHNTYQGDGGIPIGSLWRRFLFAVQLHSSNIFFSSELNSGSQLLTVRNPRARVAKVAPWLTLDGDTYPAVVNGQIEWIVDGYTTSANYPDSQRVNLHSATSTTLTTSHGASVAQPNTQVNYMQNSVKAVVNAYTGKVTLYSWNQKQDRDPLLSAWESAYPGLVRPQSSIPSALRSQLRYPTDLFNVQRTLLAKYHVTAPGNFYSGNDFWSVPTNPTAPGTLPSRYMSMSSDGYGSQRYSLSSPMVTLNGRQLAAFVSVDAQPGPDYGRITVLQFPSSAGGEAPSQVQNDIESDTKITNVLTLARGGHSRVILGELESIPVAGNILYVEPVYTQSTSSGSFPILRHIIALYDNGDPSFATSLQPALAAAFKSGSG